VAKLQSGHHVPQTFDSLALANLCGSGERQADEHPVSGESSVAEDDV
jgi:hypothetical protein